MLHSHVDDKCGDHIIGSSPEDGQHRLTEISRHLLNLNSSFQNYHMVLPQASPHYMYVVSSLCTHIDYPSDLFHIIK